MIAWIVWNFESYFRVSLHHVEHSAEVKTNSYLQFCKYFFQVFFLFSEALSMPHIDKASEKNRNICAFIYIYRYIYNYKYIIANLVGKIVKWYWLIPLIFRTHP